VVPSVKVAVAVNCLVVPNGMAGMAGVTAIETIVAGVMFSAVEPVMDSELAVTVVLPTATLLANPPALTVATPELVEFHVTVLVRSSVLPSV
jgi:hypothetical protein